MFLCGGRNANFTGSLIHIPTFQNNTNNAVHQISSPKNSGIGTTILPLNLPHGSLNAPSV